MPLTYQGPLAKKPVRSLTHAFTEGQKRFNEIGYDHIDLRLVFESIGALKSAMSSITGTKKTWVDLSVYPSDSFAIFAHETLIDPGPSRLSCVGSCKSIRVEVSIEHEQRYVRRFDDRLCYEGTDNDSILIRVQAVTGIGSIDQKPKLVEAIMHRFHLLLSAQLENLEVSTTDAFSQEPISSVDTEYLQIDDPSASRYQPLLYQLQENEKRVSSILLRVHRKHQAEVSNAWKRCINQLTRLEQCHVRLDRDMDALTKLCQTLELYHDHHWSRKHGFGLSVDGYTNLTHTPDTTVQAPLSTVVQQASEWDIRWRGQWGSTPCSLEKPMASASRYIVRSSGGKSVDQLFIELSQDNADSPEFRSAQLMLSSHFDERLSNRNAWQFEGPLQGSKTGQLNASLQRQLKVISSSLPADPPKRYPPPSKAPNIFVTLFRFIRRTKRTDQCFTELIVDQIAEKMPGFRYDQRAHVSDDYFLEFYRKHAYGYDLIQIQRMRNPERFKVYLGSSEFKVYLDDLSPTQNRVAPGIVVDFDAVLPPEWDNEYHLFTRHNRRKAIESATEHLAYFATPFFNAARPILKDHRHIVQNGALQ